LSIQDSLPTEDFNQPKRLRDRLFVFEQPSETDSTWVSALSSKPTVNLNPVVTWDARFYALLRLSAEDKDSDEKPRPHWFVRSPWTDEKGEIGHGRYFSNITYRVMPMLASPWKNGNSILATLIPVRTWNQFELLDASKQPLSTVPEETVEDDKKEVGDRDISYSTYPEITVERDRSRPARLYIGNNSTRDQSSQKVISKGASTEVKYKPIPNQINYWVQQYPQNFDIENIKEDEVNQVDHGNTSAEIRIKVREDADLGPLSEQLTLVTTDGGHQIVHIPLRAYAK
jgi:hypothetical protein